MPEKQRTKRKTKAAKRGTACASESVSLEKLIREQGVKPIKSLEELSALWPTEADPDELDEFIRTERAERRAADQDRLGP